VAQSIVYSDSPSNDAEKLAGIVDGLLTFGMVHQSVVDEISNALCLLYPNELQKLLIKEGEIAGVDEFDPDFHSAGPQYLMTFVSNQKQFIEDYRNTILVKLWPNSFDNSDVVDQVIALRG
jgi:hypothetical protein